MRWVNFNLSKKGCMIDDLKTGFQDGLMLIKLVEQISGKKVGKKIIDPKSRVQKFENISMVLKFLDKNKKLSKSFSTIGKKKKQIKIDLINQSIQINELKSFL